MVHLIVIIVLIIAGALMLNSWNEVVEVTGFALLIVCIIALIIHVVGWTTASYTYSQFLVQRDAFEQTLNNARESGNQYETAAIVKEVADWNKRLAENKYDNKILFFDCYIDDRVEDLEPIK